MSETNQSQVPAAVLPPAPAPDLDKLDWKEGSLPIAEYTALTLHYFHEDNYFLRAIALFGTINTALLTLFGSELIVRLQFGIQLAFIFIGIVTTVAWALSLIRVRYLRTRIENRIRELEQSINEFWERSRNTPPFPLLQIRNRNDTFEYWPQRVPVSKLMLIVPAAFFIIWICISVAFIVRGGRLPENVPTQRDRSVRQVVFTVDSQSDK